ncbi:WbqC family protein [Pseudomonas sp. KCJK8927]|uniref:WbqC family protein n=1 Tax=Pseudomonas sp. KCJK8927 TaxID=3344560 RepID=UPI0039057EA4
MKLAIMQPYLFPYAGYFSLVGKVDKFVFYDDVNFIKGGWINRNRLLLGGEVRYFTVPLSGASPNLKINEVKVQARAVWERKFLAGIQQSYSKAPNFEKTFDCIREVLGVGEFENIAQLAKRSVRISAERIGLSVDFVESSAVYGNQYLSASDRILDICVKEGADTYINQPGGKSLYSSLEFSSKGIVLGFNDAPLKTYKQFSNQFTPGLSMLDMMMFNTFEECKSLILI